MYWMEIENHMHSLKMLPASSLTSPMGQSDVIKAQIFCFSFLSNLILLL